MRRTVGSGGSPPLLALAPCLNEEGGPLAAADSDVVDWWRLGPAGYEGVWAVGILSHAAFSRAKRASSSSFFLLPPPVTFDMKPLKPLLLFVEGAGSEGMGSDLGGGGGVELKKSASSCASVFGRREVPSRILRGASGSRLENLAVWSG